jgi:hypothetical protein
MLGLNARDWCRLPLGMCIQIFAIYLLIQIDYYLFASPLTIVKYFSIFVSFFSLFLGEFSCPFP